MLLLCKNVKKKKKTFTKSTKEKINAWKEITGTISLEQPGVQNRQIVSDPKHQTFNLSCGRK